MIPSDPAPESEAAERAVAALREDDPEKAVTALLEALRANPERIDLMHALSVTQLRRGHPRDALEITIRGEELARGANDEAAKLMLPQFLLARAAACEDLYDPIGAERAFQAILDGEPTHPSARQGLGHLYLGWGRIDDGLRELDRYLDDGVDEPRFLKGTGDFVASLRAFVRNDVHPRELLVAHRGSYLEFFDHHAREIKTQK